MSIKGIDKKNIEARPKKAKKIKPGHLMSLVSTIVLTQVDIDAKLKELSTMCMNRKDSVK